MPDDLQNQGSVDLQAPGAQPDAPGAVQRKQLADAGYNGQELSDWESGERQKLSSAGFSNDEVDKHFGTVKPDMSAIRAHIKTNLATYNPNEPTVAEEVASAQAGKMPEIPDTQIPSIPQFDTPLPASSESPKEAKDLSDAIKAGLQISTAGLYQRGKLPDTILPEDAPTYIRIASQMSTLAGDLPLMISGGVMGGAIGTPGGPLALATGGAGAMALPAAMRGVLVEHYKKGDVQNFQDFWERTSAIFLDTLKQGVIGGATAGVGGIVGKVASPVLSAGATTAAKMASEIATMVSVGKAIEGQVPKMTDFTDAALVVAFMHGAIEAPKLLKSGAVRAEGVTVPSHEGAEATVETKLQDIYAKTGVRPDQVVEQAAVDPLTRQELLSDSNELPTAFKHLEEPVAEKGAIEKPGAEPEVPETTIETELPPKLTKQNPVLNDPEEPVSFERRAEEKDVFGLDERGAIGEKPEKELTPLEEAQQKILDRIESRPKAQGEKTTWNKFIEDWIDKLDPFRRLVDKLTGGYQLPASFDPYKLMRLVTGAKGKAAYFFKFGTFDYKTLENTGESLSEILAPHEKDKEGLNAYLASSRVLELEGRGIEHGFDLDAAKMVVEEGIDKYEQTAKRLVDYQNRTLQYLMDSGRISQEAFEKMVEANREYVPFFRISEDGEAVGGGGSSLLGKPIKAIEGSSSKIVDPIESIVRNTIAYIKLAEQNRAMSALADLAKVSPLGEELVKFKGQGGELGDNEIAVFKDGNMERYEVEPDVARAYHSMDGNAKEMGWFWKYIVAGPAKLLRSTLTLTPDFMARHAIRYELTSSQLGKYNGIPIWDSLKGLGDALFKTEAYQNWIKSGSVADNFAEMDNHYIERNVWELNKKTGFIDSMKNVVRHPIDSVRVGAELLDSSIRIANFKRVAGANPTADEIFEGGYESRNSPVDNQRIGAKMQAWNQITAFLNLHVQGLDRAVEAFKERPVATLTRVGAGITLPSVYLWWANHEDPRYKEIPQWEKDLAWMIMTPNHIYRIPKPFELGIIFGSLPERVLDGLYLKDPQAFKGFGDTLMKGFAPNILPTTAVPAVEHFANRSTLTDRSLISAPMEKLLPQLQYTEYTTESAKMIGRALQQIPVLGQKLTDQEHSLASPVIVQNYIRAWSGNLGMYALKMADQALISAKVIPDPKHADTPLSQMPFIKAFLVQFPTASATSIQGVYDEYDKHAKMINTFNEAAKTNNVKVLGELQKDPQFNEKMVNLAGAKNALARQTQVIKLIDQNPNIPTSQKRQQIDQIYSGMIEMSRAFMKSFEKK